MIEVNENDYFYDIRIYKDEIESILDRRLADTEFHMVMESYDVFHIQELTYNYIKKNKDVINLLLDDFYSNPVVT